MAVSGVLEILHSDLDAPLTSSYSSRLQDCGEFSREFFLSKYFYVIHGKYNNFNVL